jgi:hypothetical protein
MIVSVEVIVVVMIVLRGDQSQDAAVVVAEVIRVRTLLS